MKANKLSLGLTNAYKNPDTPWRKNIEAFIRQGELQIMVIPVILYLLVFSYGPIAGMIMAFQDFQLGDAVGFSKWVGFAHFETFFKDSNFLKIIRNTICISLLNLLFAFPAPIIFAILLNELRSQTYKRIIQTASYLPHFVSWVVVSGMVFDFLAPSGGLLNHFLRSIGLIEEPILFMGRKEYFWLIVVLSDIWKELGWNAIIYLAAISAIDPQLYDAASIDGAKRIHKIWYITIAGLTPTITVLLVLKVGNLLNYGFEQIVLLTNNLQNTLVSEVSETIDTYVLTMGMQQLRFSYATAIGMFKSIVAVILLVGANAFSKRISGSGLW